MTYVPQMPWAFSNRMEEGSATRRSRNPNSITTEVTEFTETKRPWAFFSVDSLPSVVNLFLCPASVTPNVYVAGTAI